MAKFKLLNLKLITVIAIIRLYLSFDYNTQCSTNKIFDPTLLACNNCPQNMLPSGDGISCVCSAAAIINNSTLTSTLSPSIGCIECPKGQAASLDRTICMNCPNGVDPQTLECSCPDGYAILEKDSSGEYLKAKICFQCPKNTYPGPPLPVYSCRACPEGKIYDTTTTPWTCTCDSSYQVAAGDECIPTVDSQLITNSYPLNIAKSLTINNVETSNPNVDSTLTIANSDTFDSLFLKSAYHCLKSLDNKSCQVLANLCVLQLYDQTNPVCMLYNHINNLRDSVTGASDLGQRQNMPWLYYQSTADKVINNTDRIKFEVSFDPNDQVNVNELNFYIAKYDIEGNFLEINQLSTEFNLCSKSYDDGIDYRSFGKTIKNSCEINLWDYQTLNYTMYFYELYLFDPEQNELIDIPVMIDNIPNPKASATVGNMNNSTNPVDWILVRRFFLIDNLSAIQGTNNYKNKNSNSLAVRFPRLIKLVVMLQNTSGSKIYVPYLEIFYKAKTLTYVQQSPQTLLIFASEYSMSIVNFKNAALAILITLIVIIIVVVCIKMHIWYRLNPPSLSPDNYSLWFLWTSLITLFQFFGVIIFWFIWGISAYWFIFFKLQYRVFVLLPPLGRWVENYSAFDITFGVGCAAFTFYLFYKIFAQSNIDIFFIDWEHDKEILVKNATELRTEKYRGAWRILHVANQFNELQKRRNISLPFCFFWLILSWNYLSWGESVSSVPTTAHASNSPDNYVLKHFLSSFVLICAGLGHFIFRRLFKLWIPVKKQEFIDLCCVANVSVFILDQSLHGYYIHGQSPAGKADSNLDELLRFLEEEGSGRVRGRGLVDKDNEDLQCYEVFISYKMRTMYDGLYGLQSETMILSAQNRDKLANQSRIVNLLKHLPKSLQIEKIYKLKTYMNAELKEKIQKVSSQSSKYVRDKTKIQRFLNYPPLQLVGDFAEDMVLYKDPNMNFDNCLLSGIEWDWFIWDIYVFQMWQLSIGSLHLSIFLTFICDQIMYYIRVYFGEKNLARKAIIDNKFFN